MLECTADKVPQDILGGDTAIGSRGPVRRLLVGGHLTLQPRGVQTPWRLPEQGQVNVFRTTGSHLASSATTCFFSPVFSSHQLQPSIRTASSLIGHLVPRKIRNQHYFAVNLGNVCQNFTVTQNHAAENQGVLLS